MLRIKDGFHGERSLVMPKMITNMLETDALGSSLYITDIGYYPAADYHYRERSQPIDQWVLIYCVNGAGWYSLGNVRHEVKTGQFFILPAGRPHCYGADKSQPWTIYWAHFKGTLAAAYAAGLHLPHSISPSRDSRIHDRTEFFEEIFYTLKQGYSMDNLLYANSLFHHYLGSLRYVRQFRDAGAGSKRLWDTPDVPQDKLVEEENVVQSTLHYMKEHLERHVTLQELVDYAGYSQTHFTLLFKQQVGHSPLSYFNLMKIQKACSMLDSTDMKINQVSSKLGFYDTFYFSRLFSKIMGMSPRDYRNRDKG